MSAISDSPEPPSGPAKSGPTKPLSALRAGGSARVQEVLASEEALARRLVEIGFVPGARVEVVAAMWPGDDPLAVRIGGSTFALRRREAARVMVEASITS